MSQNTATKILAANYINSLILKCFRELTLR